MTDSDPQLGHSDSLGHGIAFAFLVEGLVRVTRYAQLAAAEMTKIQFGIEAHMHRREMNVAPSALYRMRGRKACRPAHADERIDHVDAHLAGARRVAP
jgi:hypothetical protein